MRYADLLDDWVKTTMHVGHTLDVQSMIHTRSDQIREVHRFIDPSLRRVTLSLDDLALPPRLHELTAQTWAELNQLADDGATPPRCTPRSTSCATPTPTSTRSPRRSASRRSSPPGSPVHAPPPTPSRGERRLADRIPHDVRAKIPPSVRRGVRRALGRERPDQ